MDASQLESSMKAGTMNLTGNSYIEEERQVRVVNDMASENSQLAEFVEKSVQAERRVSTIDKDWFDLYWSKKRLDYFSHEPLSQDRLQLLAEELEQDIASFWKFKAKNTL